MKKLNEIIYWNKKTYGSAFRINKKHIWLTLTIFCLLTPCTNFLIPFLNKIIKQDLIFRY
ncbi:MAG: hypothetical protein ACOC3X_00625 [Nanoarchaeota archaeon]